MKITLETLYRYKACRDATVIFNLVFGEEAELNEENLKKYIEADKYAFRNLQWLGSMMIPGDEDWKDFISYYYRQDKTDTDKFSYKIGMKLMELLRCT